MNKNIIVIGIAAVSVLLLAINGWIFSKDKSAFARVQEVQLEPAKVMDIKRTVIGDGVIVPAENEKFYVQEQLGTISAVEVKEGEEVTPGTVLYTYKNMDLEREISSLEQKKEQNTIKETYNKELKTKVEGEITALGDDEKEAAKKASLEKEATKAGMEAELAAANNTSIDAQLTKLAEDKENLSIKSNTQGVVKTVNQGGSESAKPIVEIVSKDNVQVSADLNERDSLIVKPGEKATISSPALPDQKWNGTVAEFQEAVKGKTSSTFPFAIKIDEDHPLKVGQHVKFKLTPIIKEKAMVVPKSSLMTSKGQHYVYTVVKGYLKKRTVKTGLSYGHWMEVKAGIRAQEKIVSNPTPYLTENTDVYVPAPKKEIKKIIDKNRKKDAVN